MARRQRRLDMWKTAIVSATLAAVLTMAIGAGVIRATSDGGSAAAPAVGPAAQRETGNVTEGRLQPPVIRTTSKAGPAELPAVKGNAHGDETPAAPPGMTADEDMWRHMEEMHGPDHFEAMHEHMDAVHGEGAFESMLDHMGGGMMGEGSGGMMGGDLGGMTGEGSGGMMGGGMIGGGMTGGGSGGGMIGY
jgi:hypothetical protein